MTRADRLIQTRKKQRDVAVDGAEQARQQLESVQASEAELLQQVRQTLQNASCGCPINAAALETLDMARRQARHAIIRCERALCDAKEQVQKAHCALRQAELLKDRTDRRKLG